MKKERATTLGRKQNDECYTQTKDIYKELSQWAALDKFRGKEIICPCDWDVSDELNSITITYTDTGIEVSGNSVYKDFSNSMPTLWHSELPAKNLDIQESELEDFLNDTKICGFVKVLTQYARDWGIRSITASGYNPATNTGIKYQEVDYSKYDICITNPPFDGYREFTDAIIDKIDFIVIAPMLNRSHPCVGLYLMLRKAYLGFGAGIALKFENPTTNGIKAVACDWLTSFTEAQDARNAKEFKSGIKYKEGDYEVMPKMTMKDGTHPIRVGSTTFPEDYDGWMFASVRLLDKLDQNTYEWCGTRYISYLNTHPEISPFAHKCNDEMYTLPNGKMGFNGFVFRKRKG